MEKLKNLIVEFLKNLTDLFSKANFHPLSKNEVNKNIQLKNESLNLEIVNLSKSHFL